MSKLISIDVGIKNLGLCILYINDGTIDIVHWQTVSLVGMCQKHTMDIHHLKVCK